MKLYNTLSRKVEELQTLDGRKPGDNPAPEVKLYACGPTVYDFTHLGHLRKYTMDDVLVRALRDEGYQVRHVQNITDVGHLVSDEDDGEDKMEKGSRKHHKPATELAREFEEFFFYSMDLMGNLRPTLSCRATDHIQSQLELVQDLEKKGLTYIIDGEGVYFDTSKIKDYGKLSGIKPDQQLEGARVSVKGKRNATDFALWKFEKEGDHRQMVWPSPWHQRSFPGWHVECSAMSIEHLGPQIDIHTGGIDHIPVHHENEIAQSEAFTGKQPFSQIWVHHNFLKIDGQKMSKSLGNFYTIDDLRSRGYSARALRFLFLTSHYRSEQNFTWESMTAAQKAYLRLLRIYLDLKEELVDDESLEIANYPQAKEFEDQFKQAIANDLHTSEALSVLWALLKTDLPADIKYHLLAKFDRVLGLGLLAVDEEKFLQILTAAKNKGIVEKDFLLTAEEFSEDDLPKEVQKLFEQRELARKEKNWELADSLRLEIEEFGFQILDTADGAVIKR
jgi:cysteinyl-tRNA synthetase